MWPFKLINRGSGRYLLNRRRFLAVAIIWQCGPVNHAVALELQTHWEDDFVGFVDDKSILLYLYAKD